MEFWEAQQRVDHVRVFRHSRDQSVVANHAEATTHISRQRAQIGKSAIAPTECVCSLAISRKTKTLVRIGDGSLRCARNFSTIVQHARVCFLIVQKSDKALRPAERAD